MEAILQRGLDQSLLPLFQKLHLDEETKECMLNTPPLLIARGYFRRILSTYCGISTQDGSAIVGGNPMFVLSSTQVQQLMESTQNDDNSREPKTLLDIGSGARAVTARVI